MKPSRKSLERIFTLLPLVVALLVLAFSNNVYIRQDLTADKAYTISQFTKELIRGLEHPVELTYYLSDKLLSRDLEVQRDLDLLREMAAVDPASFRLRVVDPENLGPNEQGPEAIGIQPQNYQIIENDQTSFAVVYTGALMTYLNDYRLLPLIYDSSQLEYDITRNLLSLSGGVAQKLGILYGNSQLAQQSQYFERDMGQIAQIVPIQAGEDIPTDITALFVLGHSELSQSDSYRIDQYLMRGGSIFVSADYHHVDLSTGITPIEGSQTPMLELLDAWGFRIEPSWVLDPRNQPIPVQQQAGRIAYTEMLPYPLWPRLGSANGNEEALISSSFSGMDLYWASPIVLSADNGEAGGYTGLLFSSPEANSIVPPLQVDPRSLFPSGEPPKSDRGYMLAASFQGNIESGFSGKEEAELDPAFIPESLAPVRIVVLADEDALSDLMDLDRQNSLRNLIFSKNAFEWLSGQEALLEMRTRVVSNQRLDKIADPIERSAASGQAKFWGLVLGPLVFALIGLLRFVRRRRLAAGGQSAPADSPALGTKQDGGEELKSPKEKISKTKRGGAVK